MSEGSMPHEDKEENNQECTKPLIENYVAYGKLSSTYKTFVQKLDHVQIPNSIQKVFKNLGWKKAIEEEIQALQKNDTCVMSTLSQVKRTVGCKWIFNIKYKSDGSIK